MTETGTQTRAHTARGPGQKLAIQLHTQQNYLVGHGVKISWTEQMCFGARVVKIIAKGKVIRGRDCIAKGEPPPWILLRYFVCSHDMEDHTINRSLMEISDDTLANPTTTTLINTPTS